MKLAISHLDSLQQQEFFPATATTGNATAFPVPQSAVHPQAWQPSSALSTCWAENNTFSFLPDEISQSTFQGRTSSSGCTPIAVCLGKLFKENSNATVDINNKPSPEPLWLNIFRTAIQAGNNEHDRVAGGKAGVLCSVVGAIWHLNGRIGKTEVKTILNVGFTNKNPSLTFYLGFLSHEATNTAALVVVDHMTICFVARGGKLLALDSHFHSPFGGAMIGVCDMARRESFLTALKEKLRLEDDLCYLTFVTFLPSVD